LILEFRNKKPLPSCATDVTSISRSSVLPPEYLQALSNERVQAVIVLVDGMFFQERKRIAQLAASARLPAVYGFREHVDADGLISYGVNLADNFRRAATYVVKILKGAKPGDLAVEFPNKLELIINLKTSKALAWLGRGSRWRGSSRRWRPGGTLTRPRHGNCSAIAGTWGNGPVHHLPGKRRAVRPAVAGLRLVCATPRRRPTAAGLTGRGGRLPVGRRVRNASVRPRVHKTAPDVAPGPNIAYLLLKGGPVTLIAGRPAQPL